MNEIWISVRLASGAVQNAKMTETFPSLAWDEWDILQTAAWIRDTALSRRAAGNVSSRPHAVCLQLPDDMLEHAAELSEALQTALDMEADIYILADTTYNALSVDEVASEHVNADCIVHYGRASLSKTTGRIPVYYVLPKEHNYRYTGSIDIGVDIGVNLGAGASTSGEGSLGGQDGVDGRVPLSVTVFVDQIFKHAFGEVCEYVRKELLVGSSVTFPRLIGVEGAPSVGGYEVARSVKDLFGGCDEVIDHVVDDQREKEDVFMWYGSNDAPARELLMLTYNAKRWVSIDPIQGSIDHGLPLKLYQTLRKRYFLVDKARKANIVGVVVGTLAANGYKESINALRVAATKADKKTYTLLMGKPSPAKLANFPEIDVFVLVADPQGMILDSKEYYAPIITPYEAMLAFSEDMEWEQHKYSLELAIGDLGLEENCGEAAPPVTALVLQAKEALQVADITRSTREIIASNSAEYLVHKRSWKGVDSGQGPGSEKKEASAVGIGRVGRAAGYSAEG